MKFVKKIVSLFLAGLLAGNIPSTALWQVSAIGSNISEAAIEGNGTPVSYRRGYSAVKGPMKSAYGHPVH